MNKLSRLFFLFGFFSLMNPSILCYSQQTNAPYEVGKWPGFRIAAVSYTFDDGCANQFAVAIPMFNEFNFKLTLFTITDSIKDWTALINAGLDGHEVANHTASHINLGGLSVAAQDTQISTATALIENHITGKKCITMAYPFCAGGKDSLYQKRFVAVRSCQGSVEGATPASIMHVSSIICGSQGGVKTAKNFKVMTESAALQKGWIVYLLHGIDDDGGYSPISSVELKGSLDYLSTNSERFWVATFGDAARYVRERNCVSLTESATTDNSISLLVSDTLDNEIFDLPVSIRRPLPSGWGSASVSQAGQPVPDTVIEINLVKYIMFDAIPDGGEVVIEKINTTSIDKKELQADAGSKNFNIQFYNNSLRFTLPRSCGKEVSLSIFDLNGKSIRVFNSPRINGNTGTVELSNAGCNSGFYLVKLSDRKEVWVNKVFLY